MFLIEKSINGMNEKIGYYASFLVIPLVLVVAYEVVMRYLFNAPTIWVFEATTLIYGTHFMIGIAYTHKHDGHVAIDVFEARLPERPRTILRLIVNLVLFMPTIGMLSIWSVIYASDSWRNLENASTSWAPPLYPFKTLMAIGFILLLLQGVAKGLHDYRTLTVKTHGDSSL
jgi:TRAP-type mannitol/chloroaromatic compound transport system permease small subunit